MDNLKKKYAMSKLYSVHHNGKGMIQEIQEVSNVVTCSKFGASICQVKL